ncbi:hypothetical protein T492DRAFT_184952 [Pavlovales sp. CCMP2436]|nr:hypothetical protein T492DRAFT_184952 [Pavlovales sp. CCMP2436]
MLGGRRLPCVGLRMHGRRAPLLLLLALGAARAGVGPTRVGGGPFARSAVARSARHPRASATVASSAKEKFVLGSGSSGGKPALWELKDTIVDFEPVPAAPAGAVVAASGWIKPASIDPEGWFSSLLIAASPGYAGPGFAGPDLGLEKLRLAGRAELSSLVDAEGLPVSKSEAWRHIGVRPLYQRALASAQGWSVGSAVESSYVASGAAAVAVFVDGEFAPGLSHTTGLPAVSHVHCLRAAFRS